MNRAAIRVRTMVRLAAVSFVFAFLAVSPLAVVTASDRLIVVLYPQNNDGSPGNFLVDQAIRTTFAAESSERIEIYNEYLDVSKPRDATEEQYLRDYLLRKYAGRKVEVVIAGLSSSLDYIISNRDLFPDAPVVFCAVDESEIKKRQLPPDVIGRPAHFDVAGTLDLAFQLHPQTEHVAIVAGNSKMDLAWAATVRQIAESRNSASHVIDLIGLRLDELIERSSRLPANTVVYYLHVFQDGAGKTLVPAHVLESLSQSANAPIYGHVDTYVGRGIVGGHVFSFRTQGKNAARLALRVLAGESPEKIGIESVETNEYQFDERQLDRWKIRETQLPTKRAIHFQDETFLERYQERIAFLLVFIAVQMGLIVGLLMEMSRRKRVDRRLQQVLTELQTNEQQLRQLSGRLIDAQESERRRVARELHDDFNQMVALLSVELDLLHQKLPPSLFDLRELTEELADRVRGLSTAIHDLSHELHPLKLEQLGLVTAIRSWCKELAQGYQLTIDFSSQEIVEPVPADVALCLYRITQEGLRNVVKHSHAKTAVVVLNRSPTELTMEITDDGDGFDIGKPGGAQGLGLLSIRERLRLVGGELTIQTQMSQGTSLRIRVPLVETPRLPVGKEISVAPPVRAGSVADA